MNKAILALFLIFNLYTALGQLSPSLGTATPGGVDGSKIAKDYMDKYAGSFVNSTTANPDTPTTKTADKAADFGSKSFYSNFTCPQAINKTNLAISELTLAATNATDIFSIYGAAQKLNGMSEFLNYGCDLTGFDLLNIGQTGLNATQDAACDSLIAIIKPLVDPSAVGVPASGYQQTLKLSQQALGLANSLGNQCNITFVDPAHPLVPPQNATLEAVEPVVLEASAPFFVQSKLYLLRRVL